MSRHRAFAFVLALVTTLFLQACGGADSPGEQSANLASDRALAAFVLDAPSEARAQTMPATPEGTARILSVQPAPAPSFQILSLQVFSETRIGRTSFQYQFRVVGKNLTASGTPAWSASIVSTGVGTNVQVGAVRFSATAQGAEQTSSDILVLEVDRSRPFNVSQIQWRFSTDENISVLILRPGEGISITPPSTVPLPVRQELAFDQGLVVGGNRPLDLYTNVPAGRPTCPLYENGRLVLGCNFSFAKAHQVANPPACNAPNFSDPRNGGECWSCPSGFIRSLSAVDSGNACWRPVSEDVLSATRTASGMDSCRAGAFFDSRNGGECWTCPAGHYRTLNAVTWSTACARGVFGPFSFATQLRSGCGASSFYDPIDGGSCWQCPSGYRRTANPVTGQAACARTFPHQETTATLVDGGCSRTAVPTGFGPAFADPREGGQCWTCPVQYSRPSTATPVTANNSCSVTGGTNGLLWRFPQFPDPGVLRFTAGIAGDAFKNAKLVDAFLDKRAGGNQALKAELWEKMASKPSESAEFKAIVFAGLLNAAKSSNPSMEAIGSILAFENYIRNRRIFVADQAATMYDYWGGINAQNQFNAARTALGSGAFFNGISAGFVGGSPPGDFVAMATGATGPDARGDEFLAAFLDLGRLSQSGSLPPDPLGVGSSFNPALVIATWDAILFAFNYKDLLQLVQAINAGKAATDIFASTAAGGSLLALQLLRNAVEVVFASLTVFVDVPNAELAIADNRTKAAADVRLHQILNSTSDDAKKQLAMLTSFWATGTSPFVATDKAGNGRLVDAYFCNIAQPTFNSANCTELGVVAATVRAAQGRVALAP
jgi:hypothetical protein